MTERFIASRGDRWRALGVLALGTGLLASALYAPLLRPWWRAEARLHEVRAKITHAQQLQQAAPDLDARLAELRDMALASGNYLPEPSPTLASAGLAQRLQEIASEVSDSDSVCVLGNRAPMEGDQESTNCQEVRFNIDMRCGTAALQRALRAIELEPPRLRIVHLSVGAAPNPAGFDKPPTPNAPLDVSIEVAGCLIPHALSGVDMSGHG